MRRNNRFTAALALCSIFFISCHSIYMDQPQPAGVRNIYHFPKAYRGQWGGAEDSIIIDKNDLKIIDFPGNAIALTEIDSNGNYRIADSLIYETNKIYSPYFIGKFPYKLKNDTVFFTSKTTNHISLSRSAFLRKIKQGYLFNLENDNNWWTVIYITKSKNGDIVAATMNYDKLNLISNKKFVADYEYDHYLGVAWTKKEMETFIENGYFSDTILVLPKNGILIPENEEIPFSFEVDFNK